MDKEVEYGWSFSLTIDSIRHIKNTGVVPLGIADQLSITKKVERYTKRRVTHDCYFPSPSGTSINKRVLRDSLQPCFCGFCLLRRLHMVEVMYPKWHSKRTLTKKYLNAAYQSIYANAYIESLCITIMGRIAFIYLCLPCVTTPEP